VTRPFNKNDSTRPFRCSGPTSSAVIPQKAVRIGCAHPSLVAKLIKAGINSASCASNATIDLKAVPRQEYLVKTAEEYAKLAGSRENTYLDAAHAPDLEIIFSTPSGEQPAQFVGAAFSLQDRRASLTEIGIRPQAAHGSHPTKVRLTDWTRRSLWLLLYDGRKIAANHQVTVDPYYLQEADAVRPDENHLEKISAITVRVNLARGGTHTCFKADMLAGSKEADFRPC
jgi:hypothetical protein